MFRENSIKHGKGGTGASNNVTRRNGFLAGSGAELFFSSKITQLNKKQRWLFVSSVVSFPCRACFSAPLINQDMFHICLILSSPTIPLWYCIFAVVMTITCPLLMLIAPYFGLCACGTGGGQKFPLGLDRPVQGFLPFLGMWAKDYCKVNKREMQHFLFLLPAQLWDLLLFFVLVKIMSRSDWFTGFS